MIAVIQVRTGYNENLTVANRLVDRIGPRIELYTLPVIGLIILGTNLVLGLLLYRRERAGSYLLWGAAAAVQALFWLAVLSIVP